MPKRRLEDAKQFLDLRTREAVFLKKLVFVVKRGQRGRVGKRKTRSARNKALPRAATNLNGKLMLMTCHPAPGLGLKAVVVLSNGLRRVMQTGSCGATGHLIKRMLSEHMHVEVSLMCILHGNAVFWNISSPSSHTCTQSCAHALPCACNDKKANHFTNISLQKICAIFAPYMHFFHEMDL